MILLTRVMITITVINEADNDSDVIETNFFPDPSECWFWNNNPGKNGSMRFNFEIREYYDGLDLDYKRSFCNVIPHFFP